MRTMMAWQGRGAAHIAGMTGRVKRLAGLAEAEARSQRARAVESCALCGRPLGRRTEWHHRVPKSQGGTVTVPVHPICHRAIHASVSNRDLATRFADLDALRDHADIARFLGWIAGKHLDFHAPTSHARATR